jgi:monoamine oxidase
MRLTDISKFSSTGLFDQAFLETLCDNSDFQEVEKEGKGWWRLDGGMQTLTDAMKDYVTSKGVKIFTNSPVTAMQRNSASISVSWTDASGKNPQTKEYESVFSTTALACLERMDIQGLSLPDDILTGIRALSYDRATKVAIKFKSPWWTNRIPMGGVSSSDLPIRNVVYPSWNDGANNDAVLMISYAWAQDATRMGSLVRQAEDLESQWQPNVDDPIVALCLENLVKLWAGRYPEDNITVDQLRGMYVNHHAWAWSHDPNTGGAFALFGPGQFKYLYPLVQTPQCTDPNSKAALYICGEATSAHHAWISGAIDSAYTSVYQWGLKHPISHVPSKLNDSFLGGGENLHAAEMDEKLMYWAVQLAE